MNDNASLLDYYFLAQTTFMSSSFFKSNVPLNTIQYNDRAFIITISTFLGNIQDRFVISRKFTLQKCKKNSKDMFK